MHSSHLLIEEPIRMISILEPSKPVSSFAFFFILQYYFHFFYFFKYIFCICRISSLQWRRSLVLSVLNLDRSRLFLLALKLECLVYNIIICFFLLLHCYLSPFSNPPSFDKWLFDVRIFTCSIVVARFDFSLGDSAFHQETLDNLKIAIKATEKLCAVSLFI